MDAVNLTKKQSEIIEAKKSVTNVKNLQNFIKTNNIKEEYEGKLCDKLEKIAFMEYLDHWRIFKTYSGDYIASISPYSGNNDEIYEKFGYELYPKSIRDNCLHYIKHIEKNLPKKIKLESFTDLLKKEKITHTFYNCWLHFEDFKINNLIYSNYHDQHFIYSPFLEELIKNRKCMVNDLQIKKKHKNILDKNLGEKINDYKNSLEFKSYELYITQNNNKLLIIHYCNECDDITKKNKIEEEFTKYDKIIFINSRKGFDEKNKMYSYYKIL